MCYLCDLYVILSVIGRQSIDLSDDMTEEPCVMLVQITLLQLKCDVRDASLGLELESTVHVYNQNLYFCNHKSEFQTPAKTLNIGISLLDDVKNAV